MNENLRELSEKATPGPWIAKFNEYGGYDCMTDSWDVSAPELRRHVVCIDQGSFGQGVNKRPFNSPEAEANARFIAAAVNYVRSLFVVPKRSHSEQLQEELEPLPWPKKA